MCHRDSATETAANPAKNNPKTQWGTILTLLSFGADRQNRIADFPVGKPSVFARPAG
jgi:hypothetical protein